MKKCLFLSMFLINLLSLNAQNRFLTSKARAANVLNTINTQPVATTSTATATVAAPSTAKARVIASTTISTTQPLAKVSTVSSAAPAKGFATPTKAAAAPAKDAKSAPSKIKYKY